MIFFNPKKQDIEDVEVKDGTKAALPLHQTQNGMVLIGIGLTLLVVFSVVGYKLMSKKDEVAGQSSAIDVETNTRQSTSGTSSEEVIAKKIKDDIEKANLASGNGKSSVPEFPATDTVELDDKGNAKPKAAEDMTFANYKNKGGSDSFKSAYPSSGQAQPSAPLNYQQTEAPAFQKVENVDELNAEKLKQYAALSESLKQSPSVSGSEPDSSKTKQGIKEDAVQAIAAKPAATVKLSRVLQAGDSVMVEIPLKTNTDRPMAVFAKVLSGKIKGATLIGSATKNDDDTVSISFSSLSTAGENGKTTATKAIAIDPVTGDTGIVGDVNHKIFQRFILPSIAVATGTYGQLISQVGQTTVSNANTTVTQSSNVSGSKVAAAAVGAAATQVATTLAAQANVGASTQLAGNLLLEVKFLEDLNL